MAYNAPPPPYSSERAPFISNTSQSQSSRKQHYTHCRQFEYGSVSTTTLSSYSGTGSSRSQRNERDDLETVYKIIIAVLGSLTVILLLHVSIPYVVPIGLDRQQCVNNTLRRKQGMGSGGTLPNALLSDENSVQQLIDVKFEIDSEVVSQSINETEEYQAAGIHWDDPVPHDTCTSYGKREYSARLWGLPPFHGWEQACHSTSNVIHDQFFETPYKCENRGIHGMYGHWIVGDEVACKPYWLALKEEGCLGAGTGKRRFHARLEGLRQQDMPNGADMCNTTPNTVNGVKYDRPVTCSYWGIWRTPGMYGIWDVDDEDCC